MLHKLNKSNFWLEGAIFSLCLFCGFHSPVQAVLGPEGTDKQTNRQTLGLID